MTMNHLSNKTRKGVKYTHRKVLDIASGRSLWWMLANEKSSSWTERSYMQRQWNDVRDSHGIGRERGLRNESDRIDE